MNKFLIAGCMIITGINIAMADMYSALQYVYDNSPAINQKRELINMADADVQSVATEFQPYLGLVGNVGLATTEIADYTFDYSPMQYGMEFQQNIFQGGANLARYKGAKHKLIAAKANLYATQQEVLLSAINAYIEVLNAQRVLELNENNQRVLQKYHELVQDRQQVGMLTKTDLSQATARLEMANYYVTDARAKYDNALETFRRIYGTIEYGFCEIDMNVVSNLLPESIGDAQEEALRQHPVLIALGAQEDAAKQSINAAYQSMLPSIDVRAALQQINNVPYLDDVRDGRVGVYLRIPLYDKGNAFANSDKARANIAIIQDEIMNARRVVIENLRIAWNLYDAQEMAISAAVASINANKLALDGIQDEQASGRRTVLDVLNAEQELLQSRVAHVQATHAKISAFFAILSAVGKLTPENLGINTN